MTAVQSAGFAADLAALLPDLAAMAEPGAVALRLADSLACALGAEALADRAENTVARVRWLPKGAGRATIWATGETAAPDYAALRNAVAVRYLDYNDTYVGRAIIHPSDMLPALVALAEERGVGWDRLIGAVTVGYEVHCRLADQAGLRPHGFDASTLTPVACAAGAAWLLGLDAEGAAAALGIAALDAGMLRAVRQGRLSDWKTLASPRGAVKGLFAALMAETGTRPPDRVFENAEGFSAHVAGPLRAEAEAPARLPRTLLKAHPAQIFIQGLIGLAQDLHRQAGGVPFAAARIATFRMTVDLVGAVHPPGGGMNRETADHSAAFAVAAVLSRGGLGHDDYDALLADPAVGALMERVTVEEDAEATRAFPRDLPSRIEAELADGRMLTAAHQTPALPGPAALAAKFAALWPVGRPRGWAWALPDAAPPFPAQDNLTGVHE